MTTDDPMTTDFSDEEDNYYYDHHVHQKAELEEELGSGTSRTTFSEKLLSFEELQTQPTMNVVIIGFALVGVFAIISSVIKCIHNKNAYQPILEDEL